MRACTVLYCTSCDERPAPYSPAERREASTCCSSEDSNLISPIHDVALGSGTYEKQQHKAYAWREKRVFVGWREACDAAPAVDLKPPRPSSLLFSSPPLDRKQAVKRIRGVKYVVAPYEADAQLGFLARNGHVDAVITEDSDILLFGCTRVLFKLDRDGMCQEVDLREMFHRRYNGCGCNYRKYEESTGCISNASKMDLNIHFY